MNPFLYFMQIVLVGSTGLSSASVDGKTHGTASTDLTGGACADGFLCCFDGHCYFDGHIDQIYPPPSSTSSVRPTIRDGPSCNFFSGHVGCSPANMNPFLYFMQIVLVGSTGLSSASVDGKTHGTASTDLTGGACADGFLCCFDGHCYFDGHIDQIYPPPSSTSSVRPTIRDGPSCNFFSGHVGCSPANMNPFLYFMQIVLVGSTGLSSASVDGKTHGTASTDLTGGACADGFLCCFDGHCYFDGHIDQIYPPPSSTSSVRPTIRDGPSCNFFSGHVGCSPANMNPFLYFMQAAGRQSLVPGPRIQEFACHAQLKPLLDFSSVALR
ncbi:uncharacterized protein LOC142775799 [Rhipicephalus microplus]|uniref:uncharacterized protein LOC142775799 n=1 Tax=Rhipicephalus microplus TaxID=6941 RepID=UPI003F6CCF46